MKEIYVSTGAFKTKDINEILKIAGNNGINCIELSAGLIYNEKTIEIVKKAKNDFKFLVHNYFPTPEKSFCLNLASNDEKVIKNSMELCKNAIDLIHFLGQRVYSVHCGYTFDGSGKELGSSEQLKLKRLPLVVAEQNFINNIEALCKYAAKYNIDIAIENNVVAQYAAKIPELYIGTTEKSLLNILNKISYSNLGILLDLAHAKVSSTFIKFSVERMIKNLRSNIKAVHISENSGYNDTNDKINRKSNLLKLLPVLRDKIITLEVYNLEPEEIKQQILLLQEVLK